jgi:hypothetical protein
MASPAKRRRSTVLDDLDLSIEGLRAKPGGASPQPAFHEKPVAAEPSVASTGGDIQSRAVNLTAYLLPDGHKRVRRPAVERDTSIQALVTNGIDTAFQGADLASVQRWDPKRKVRTWTISRDSAPTELAKPQRSGYLT